MFSPTERSSLTRKSLSGPSRSRCLPPKLFVTTTSPYEKVSTKPPIDAGIIVSVLRHDICAKDKHDRGTRGRASAGGVAAWAGSIGARESCDDRWKLHRGPRRISCRPDLSAG